MADDDAKPAAHPPYGETAAAAAAAWAAALDRGVSLVGAGRLDAAADVLQLLLSASDGGVIGPLGGGGGPAAIRHLAVPPAGRAAAHALVAYARCGI